MKIFYQSKKKKSINWFFIFGLLLLGLFFISLFYFLINSSWLKVKDIEVKGNYSGDKNVLINNLVSVISRKEKFRFFFNPNNLFFWFRINNSSVLKELNFLSQLEIKVDFWRQKVLLVLKERGLKGVFCFEKLKKCYFFDEKGFVFGEAPYLEGGLILKVLTEEENFVNLVAGSLIFKEISWVDNFFSVLADLESLNIKIRKIIVKNQGLREWEVWVFNGPKLRFSFDYSPPLKRILSSLQQKNIFSQAIYLDFRVPYRVYYRL